jgi:LuxR family transcriptional regulator, maltose regulon positive regulatory protein
MHRLARLRRWRSRSREGRSHDGSPAQGPRPQVGQGSMSIPVLATKLHVPTPPPNVVLRTRLVQRLNGGLYRKLTLICAPAGFGKTTLVSVWAAGCDQRVGWLSLDDGDTNLSRFLVHLVSAVRTVAPSTGEAVLGFLQSPQPPPMESTLTCLVNEIATVVGDFILVIDDYHLVDAKPVDKALTFLLEHLPPQMHLVIASREDPQLPLARLRGGGHLSELRAADLRFTTSEAAAFLNESMGLNLSARDVATLETRTEGWVAGLQLAALSLQGHPNPSGFVESFSGSHHFVLDYLLEEVLQRQPEDVQAFLLRTSILDRLCGPLCDAVLRDRRAEGQATLEYLQRGNLFVVPLDNERRWYRYHHLFRDLLRQRLQLRTGCSDVVPALHLRASLWYEEHGLEVEAFQHAAAANDIERAERLIESPGVPLQYRGAGASVLDWLESLPTAVLDARPSLWVTYAAALFFVGRHTAVEQRLQAAESALSGTEVDGASRDVIGRIASIRATLAIIQHDTQTIVVQSRRALDYLRPDNVPIRTATTYTLGYAQQLQGDRGGARRAYAEVISIGRSFRDSIYTIAATLGLGQLQEADIQLLVAKQAYQRVLELAGDPPRGLAAEAHLGLARIHYEWNELNAAEQHAQQCLQISEQTDSVDTFVSYAVFLARLRLARGDALGSIASLDEAEEFVRQHNFGSRLPDVAAVRVLVLLHQRQVDAAAHLAQVHELPALQARVHLARRDTSAALALLEPWRREVEARGWRDKRLEVLLLQAIALQAHGDRDAALDLLLGALALAEPGDLVRSFADEGVPMARLLSAAAAYGTMPAHARKLLELFETGSQPTNGRSPPSVAQPLVEPLSPRELEVLRLIAQGLSNHQIGERLFLALDTVKGHNRKIFGKLQVQRRTEAVARARELGLS